MEQERMLYGRVTKFTTKSVVTVFHYSTEERDCV